MIDHEHGPSPAAPGVGHVMLISASHPHVPCGVGDYTNRLAESLASVGLTVSILTTLDPRLEADGSVQLIAAETQWRLRDLPGLLRLLRRARPDVIHLQYPAIGYGRGFGATFLPAAAEILNRGVVSATTLHEFSRFSQPHRARVALGAAASGLVIVPDVSELEIVRHALPPIRRRLLVHIPVSGNIAAGAYPVSPREDRDELVIGHWGFLRPDKRVEDLVDAAAIVSKKQRVRLILAGDPGPDTEYISSVRRRVEAKGLGEVTTFGSWLPAASLSALLTEFDVCVLPFREGLATNRTTYATAVEHGLNVVTTSREPRPPDTASNTWFARPEDPESLAEAIVAAASHPPLAQRPTSPTWREIAEAHIQAYSDLRSRRR